jgi:hypothetical protein
MLCIHSPCSRLKVLSRSIGDAVERYGIGIDGGLCHYSLY